MAAKAVPRVSWHPSLAPRVTLLDFLVLKKNQVVRW